MLHKLLLSILNTLIFVLTCRKINGTFHANTEFPGHIVQYSYDEGVTRFDVFDGFHPKRNTILLRSRFTFYLFDIYASFLNND